MGEDLDRVRGHEYVRVVAFGGHLELVCRYQPTELEQIERSLEGVGGFEAAAILRVVRAIDAATRDARGLPYRDFTPRETQALERADQALFRVLPALEILLEPPSRSGLVRVG